MSFCLIEVAIASFLRGDATTAVYAVMSSIVPLIMLGCCTYVYIERYNARRGNIT
jgi:hypothetical protein